MDRDLGRGLAHAGGAGRLGDAGALELDPVDQAARALGQRLHGAGQVEPRLDRSALRRPRELKGVVVERQVAGMAAGPAQMVDQLVARDRMGQAVTGLDGS